MVAGSEANYELAAAITRPGTGSTCDAALPLLASVYGRHSLLSPTLLYAPAVIRRREILPIKARVPCYSSWAVKPNCAHSGVLLKPAGLSITIGKYTVRRLLPCVWFLLAELCLASEPPWSNNDHFITQGTCSIGSCPLACVRIAYRIRTVRVSATRCIFH